MSIISFIYYIDPDTKKHQRLALVSIDHINGTAIILIEKKFRKVPLEDVTFASWE